MDLVNDVPLRCYQRQLFDTAPVQTLGVRASHAQKTGRGAILYCMRDNGSASQSLDPDSFSKKRPSRPTQSFCVQSRAIEIGVGNQEVFPGDGQTPAYKRANVQYLAMGGDEIWDMIRSAKKTIVSFTLEDGYPHSTPVWFCVLDRKIYFRTHSNKVKLRLVRNGKVCCVWEEGVSQRELRGAIIWGRARVVREKHLEEAAAKALADKYRGLYWNEAELPEWLKNRKESRSIVEISPLRISSWDNTKISK